VVTPRVSGVDAGQRHLNGPQTTGRTYQNLSPPRHTVRSDLDVPIAVRDGARLIADVLRPDSDGRFPALVAASPYPRQLQNSGAPFGFVEAGASDFFVPRGYAHVLVNLRGTGGSDGTYTFFDAQERRDVCDVVEWVAAQPWCDENVGMIGISGFAIAQLEAAVERPPHLRAVFPVAVSLDLYEAIYHYGVFSDVFATGFVGGMAVMADRRSSVFRNPLADAASRLFLTNAVHARFEHFQGESAIAALAAVGARHISKPPWDALFVGVAVDHQTRDEFWAERDLAARLDDVGVPCYIGCDWDNVPLHLPSTFTAWRGLTGRVPVRMAVMGSGGLTWPWESLHVEALAWFDHWLKGADTGILDGPPIRYWLPGADEWREATDWPPAGVRFVRLGLHPDGRLASGETPPGTREYVLLAPGARRRPAPEIPGQLRWETQPFRDALDVVGPLEVALDAATSALDTVWMVTIQDVAPDGTTTNVTAGWLRAALRKVDEAASAPGRPSLPCREAVPVPPGEMLHYRIPIVDTAHRFRPGHRLALVLASDDRHDGPAFSGFRHASPGPARQTIAATSGLVLPVLAGGAAFEPER
jgi:uncharacterized protein